MSKALQPKEPDDVLSESAWIEQTAKKMHEEGVYDPIAIAEALLNQLDDDELHEYALIGMERKVRSVNGWRRRRPVPKANGSKWDSVRSFDPGDWSYEVNGVWKPINDFTQADVAWMAQRFDQRGQEMFATRDRWKSMLNKMRRHKAQTILEVRAHVDIDLLLPESCRN